ncbi:hypothetical protein SeLEV6574_g02139 [Synchytrium endobioticum]|uniref:Ankyrin n=1 Tax=Synchytrium endobioticum TaxID=286115 RepID=A0A507D9C3_9FUNG|nr:hypothetical protein SeLEV6574_g02139 [Synchytrium endobioticum]
MDRYPSHSDAEYSLDNATAPKRPGLLSISMNSQRRARSNSASLPVTKSASPSALSANSRSNTSSPVSPGKSSLTDTESELSFAPDSPAGRCTLRQESGNQKICSQLSIGQILLASNGYLVSPRSVSFADFCRCDRHAQKRKEAMKKLVEAAAGEPADKFEGKSRGDGKGPLSRNNSSFGKIAGFLKASNRKCRFTRSGALHVLRLAIHDNRTSFACRLIDEMPIVALGHSRKHEMSKAFIHSMLNSLERPISDIPDFLHPSFFIVAVAMGLEHVVRAMIKKANVNQDWYQIRPLHLACSSGNTPLANLLLDHGAISAATIGLDRLNMMQSLKSPYAKTYEKMKESHLAPSQSIMPLKSHNAFSNPSRNSTLIQQGLNRNKSHSQAQDSLNSTWQSGQSGHPELRLAVVEHRRAVLAEFSVGKHVLPLELALANGVIALGKLLIQKTEQKVIAASKFCLLLSRDFEASVMLHKAGASLSQVDAFGNQPLHLAARRGDLDLTIALVICKADVDAKGENGWTALHEAISREEWDVARILVHLGANINITNSEGLIPRELGLAFGHPIEKVELALDGQRPLRPALTDIITKVTNASNRISFPSPQDAHNRRGVSLTLGTGYTPPSPSLLVRRRTGMIQGGAITGSPTVSLSRSSSRSSSRSTVRPHSVQQVEEDCLGTPVATTHNDATLSSPVTLQPDSSSNAAGLSSLPALPAPDPHTAQKSSPPMPTLALDQAPLSYSPIPVAVAGPLEIKGGRDSPYPGPANR